MSAPPIIIVHQPVGLEAGSSHAWRFRVQVPDRLLAPPSAWFRIAVRWLTAAGEPFELPPTDLVLPGPLAPGQPREVVVPIPTPDHPGDFRIEAGFDPFPFPAPGPKPMAPTVVRTKVTVHAPAGKDIDYHAVYRATNLKENHWWVVGAFQSREEYDASSDARLEMLCAFGLTPDTRVLDIGCGTGQMAQCLEGFLSDRGKYYGSDIAPEAMAYCKDRFRRPNFVFAQGDMTSVPFAAADGPFDLVLFFSVFTHVFPDEVALLAAEARRLLAPGGTVIADAFFTPLVERHGGNRGEMFLNRGHFDRLMRLAGFGPAEVLRSFPWTKHSERHMMRFRAAGDPC